MRLRFTRAAALALAALVASPACSSTETAEAPRIPCASTEIALAMDRAEDVRVVVDEALAPQVRDDLRAYLGRLWGRSVDVNVGTPESAPGDVIWISASDAARAKAAPPDEGYALVRADEGSRRLVVVAASAPTDLATASYALLEELGVRIFHPMQELVPELGAPHLPRALDVRRTPMAAHRGLHVHLLHPLEYFRSLHEPGEDNLAEARRLVDWLVKTGQNHLQWTILGSVPWEPFAEHARRIVEYAHARGVTVGGTINVSSKSSLQNGYVLVRDEANADAEIAAGLDRLMQVPWDDVELSFGEFLGAEPDATLRWLDAVAAHLGKIAPQVRVAVHNHVGNYPHLYVDYQGERTFFYHLPKHGDPRLGQTVHTVFFYDLYRERGMYNHPNFHLHRDYIFEQLPTRRVRYFPESAYWIASDIDVPIFLPEYVESRWVDIHNLDRDIRARGLPALDGHTMYSSGHEWGYWMTDYLTAKMLWEPAAPLGSFVDHYAKAYGTCAPDVGAQLARFIELQRLYLFDKDLVPYVCGEDQAIDLSALAGLNHRPVRRSFDSVATATEEDRTAFEATVDADLDAMAKESGALEDGIAARCRGSDPALLPWCEELRDGVRIVRERLEHTIALYRAVIAHARGRADEARRHLAAGIAKTEEAAATIAERERHYRFDLDRLTAAYPNPTVYPFGDLRQAHTQCLWRRQDEQARRVVEEGLIGSTTGLPTCLD